MTADVMPVTYVYVIHVMKLFQSLCVQIWSYSGLFMYWHTYVTTVFEVVTQSEILSG